MLSSLIMVYKYYSRNLSWLNGSTIFKIIEDNFARNSRRTDANVLDSSTTRKLQNVALKYYQQILFNQIYGTRIRKQWQFRNE